MYVISTPNNLLSRGAAIQLGLIKRTFKVSEELFGTIGNIKGGPVKITLREDAEPYSINVSRRIPLPIMDKVEEKLKSMEADGVICKVTEPTEWCSPIVPVMKRNGDVRICVDLKKVNAAVKREGFTLPTFEQVTGKLQGSTVYSVLDGASGYWQLSLDEQSSKYTTFITPFGRFRFLKLPFGISIASEVFQRRMMDVLGDLEGVVVYQDDILVHGSSMTIHDERLEKLLARIKEVGLKLNREKCQFRKKSLNFLGSRISAEDISSDGSKVEAIHNIAVPENVTEMKRYIGILNYLGRHISNLSEMSQPLISQQSSQERRHLEVG